MISKPHIPLHYFLLLDHEEQSAAIRRLAASGLSDPTIATITGQSIQHVRRALEQRSTANRSVL
jgi:hypothetical protein